MLLCAQVLEIISYVTIIPGQSMTKMQKVSYKRAIPQENDLTTSILHLALLKYSTSNPSLSAY